MKLLRFGNKDNEKPGIEIEGKRFDCSEHFKDWNHNFFQNEGISKLKEIVATKTLHQIDNSIRLGSPIARPGMIMCIGLNYSDHAKEAGLEIPKEPILFMKATNTLSGPNDAVVIPPKSTKTDWEVELGIVINKDCYQLKNEAEGEQHIAGYTVVHDVSEREFQIERQGQWVKGKSCPGFSPVGPYLVLKEAINDVLNLNMTLSVNGKTMQNGNTKFMIFKPDYIVYYLSQFMQLEAGDLISTGTPPGVGLGFKPPIYLKRGDEVIIEIEGIGVQRQKFK
ncbi:2-keto-4-pentenoate hydratase/2-oxohepta-3-ene-1,7-dioic acid hydratase in catechol pathway [Flavobacteriaceae bacterium MAR_2010_72]|nr:2-keto-4-pentenoate hydratase/2-oxohepta-3-ene-1,7-dioic acid hydratase in catechol pathway [Flavobacteriaceae bacterium MAR_2010_72]